MSKPIILSILWSKKQLPHCVKIKSFILVEKWLSCICIIRYCIMRVDPVQRDVSKAPAKAEWNLETDQQSENHGLTSKGDFSHILTNKTWFWIVSGIQKNRTRKASTEFTAGGSTSRLHTQTWPSWWQVLATPNVKQAKERRGSVNQLWSLTRVSSSTVGFDSSNVDL